MEIQVLGTILLAFLTIDFISSVKEAQNPKIPGYLRIDWRWITSGSLALVLWTYLTLRAW